MYVSMLGTQENGAFFESGGVDSAIDVVALSVSGQFLFAFSAGVGGTYRRFHCSCRS
jgi:hypothetical protein